MDSENPYPLYQDDLKTPLGIIPRDDLPKFNAGVDVIVIGKAYTKDDKRSVKVSLRIGKVLKRDIIVFGERRWIKKQGKFTPSTPEEFSDLPLSHERAYGGQATIKKDGMEIKLFYFFNPEGRGFVMDEQEVLNTPLPNLENPSELLTNWEDRPIPMFWSAVPLHTFLHVWRAISFEGNRMSLTFRIFSRAHPYLVIPVFPFGEEVSLTGVTPEGRWSWRLPSLKIKARLNQGATSKVLNLMPDTLVILAEEKSYYICYRGIIPYQYSPTSKSITLSVEGDKI